MFVQNVLSAAVLFGSIFAAELDPRAACNRDNCLRQVVASNAAPGPAKGSADCQSFMTTTFTPCALTVTVTAPAVIITVTSSSTTSTITTTTTTPVVTVTTTTVTKTTTTKGPPMRVMARANPLADAAADYAYTKAALEARATSACGTTTKSTSIPTYASNCLSPSQYSSACSCNGVTATTVTKPASTVTTTTTPTSTTTVVIVATNTITITSAAMTSTTTVTSTSTSTRTADYCTNTPDTRTDYCANGSSCKETTFCYNDQNTGSCASPSMCGNDCSGVQHFSNGECFIYYYCC